MPLPPTPTDLFTSLTPTMDNARGVVARLGLRMHRVYLVVEKFEDKRGKGEAEVSFTEILPPPRVDIFSAARIAYSAGAYLPGTISISKISRTFRREQLLGLTESGDARDAREKFTIGLVARGQTLMLLYKPASDPVLEALAWKMTLSPVNRRLEAPGE